MKDAPTHMTRVCRLGENGVKYKDEFRTKKIQTLRLKTTLSGEKRLTTVFQDKQILKLLLKSFVITGFSKSIFQQCFFFIINIFSLKEPTKICFSWFCSFRCLMLYIQVNNFSVMLGRFPVFLG